jgi:hypothetical protein
MEWIFAFRLIIILAVAIPFAWLVTWILPLPGIGGVSSWWHFRMMQQMYNIETRARKLNKGLLSPDQSNEAERFYSTCSEVELVEQLYATSKTYSGAWCISDRLWGELRFLKAGKTWEVEPDGQVKRTNSAQWKDTRDFFEASTKYARSKAPNFEEQAVDVVDFEIPPHAEKGRPTPKRSPLSE